MINFGRNIGYSLDSERKASYSFDGNGRMSGMNIGENKDFSFGYLPNTYIQNTINYPNGLVKTVNFETNRNLISSVEHGFTDSIISKYSYTNDLLGRRTGKVQHFNNEVKNFDFGYNPRSEVTSATEQNNPSFNYGFNYDNIGNRISETENNFQKEYKTNALNQYLDSNISYDADGNQTKIKSSTGIWEVEYNGENRPIKFIQGDSIIFMNYDYKGRRFKKKIENTRLRVCEFISTYLYNGYSLLEENRKTMIPNGISWIAEYAWDPIAGMSSCPLTVKYDKNVQLFYQHDGSKNVTQVILSVLNNRYNVQYEYDAFGTITRNTCNAPINYLKFIKQNPFRFSSEYFDEELGLVYYNYRHYNPLDGRWINKDPLEEDGGWNLYSFIDNSVFDYYDFLGAKKTHILKGIKVSKKAFAKFIRGKYKKHIKDLKVNEKGEIYIPEGIVDPSTWEDIVEVIGSIVDVFTSDPRYDAKEQCKYDALKNSILKTENYPAKCITTKEESFCCVSVIFFIRSAANISIKEYINVVSTSAQSGKCSDIKITSPILNSNNEEEFRDDIVVEVQTCTGEK